MAAEKEGSIIIEPLHSWIKVVAFMHWCKDTAKQPANAQKQANPTSLAGSSKTGDIRRS